MSARWKFFFLAVLCSFPAMASPYLPLGSSLRPVWVALSLLTPWVILIGWGRPQAGILARQTWYWCLPWMVFLGTYLLAAVWHQKHFGLISIQVSRLLLGALVYASARLIGLRWTHLRWATCIGCVMYGLLACFDWWMAFSPAPAVSFTDALSTHLASYRVGLGANPIALGNQLVWLMGMAVMAQLLIKNNSLYSNVGTATAAVMGLVACLLTLSRGPLLGLPVLLVLMLIFAPSQQRIRIGLTTLGLFVSIATILWIMAPSSRLVAAAGQLSNLLGHRALSDAAIGERLEMWALVAKTIPKWPILGSGTSGVSDLVAALALPAQSFSAIAGQSHFHSDWLQPFAMGGAVLLLGQLSTLVIMLYRSRGNPVLVWVVLAPMAFGLTDRVIHENNSFGFFVVAWALCCAAFDNQTGQEARSG